jgi:hypothetical protein
MCHCYWVNLHPQNPFAFQWPAGIVSHTQSKLVAEGPPNSLMDQGIHIHQLQLPSTRLYNLNPAKPIAPADPLPALHNRTADKPNKLIHNNTPLYTLTRIALYCASTSPATTQGRPSRGVRE